MRPQRDYPMLFWRDIGSTRQGRSTGSNAATNHHCSRCAVAVSATPTTFQLTTVLSPRHAGAAAHRALLGGPADALNRASRPHSSTKEYSGPSKAMGIEREQNLAPVPVPAPELVQPASSAAGAAVAAAQPAPTDATQPAAAVKQQRTLEGGPADIFNRATHARQSTKEVSGPSKATGVNTPSESQQEPSTEPGSRSLLQYGWSGSSASASASAGAGSGGWGGNSWAGAQGECAEESTDCCIVHALECEAGCLHALASWLLSSPKCS